MRWNISAFWILFVYLSQSYFLLTFASKETLETETTKDLPSFRILSVARFKLLPNRQLLMIENEGMVHPFYISSGINSGAPNTAFPFDNISGRFHKGHTFSQNYVEKTGGTKKDQQTLLSLGEDDKTQWITRFGSVKWLRASALIGGGIWDKEEGSKITEKLGIRKQSTKNTPVPIEELETAAEVLTWMQRYGFKPRLGIVGRSQESYARFSYLVMIALLHHLDHPQYEELHHLSFRDLSLKLSEKILPQTFVKLCPGFTKKTSPNDFSQYVDLAFPRLNRYLMKDAYIKISLNFYIDANLGYIENDILVFQALRDVEKNDYPYVYAPHYQKLIEKIETALNYPTSPHFSQTKTLQRTASTPLALGRTKTAIILTTLSQPH
jgi:hypothetical protein